MSKPIIQKMTLEQAERIINTRYPPSLFYFLDAGVYVGIDNSTGDAWTEEFPDLRTCKRWLSNPNLIAEEIIHE